MYKIIMVSPGGTKRDFQGGFKNETEAENIAKELNWEFCDEHGFVWNLEITEDYDITADLIIPNRVWAKTFLEFREHNGDDSALLYLMDTMENNFNRDMRLRFAAIRRLVDSAYALNYVIAMMEYDEIPLNTEVEKAYRILMHELSVIAEKSRDIV